MRTWMRSKVRLLFMTCAVLLAVPAIALANDQLQDELDSTPASATITQNDTTGFTNDYYVRAIGGNPPVCDISETNPATFKINVPAGSGVVATPDTLTFTKCGDINTNTQSVKFTSTTANNTTGYAITATQTVGDSVSVGNAAFTLYVNPAATPPATPTLDLAAASDSGDSASDDKTNVASPTFQGYAKADSTVKVYDGTVELGTVTANGSVDPNNANNKAWSYTLTAAQALSEGTHTIKATASNTGGTSAAAELSVLIDKTAPAANCGSADSNWHGSNVSIACAPTDTGGSGLSTATATLTPTSFNLVTNVAAGNETNNASTNSRNIYDVAGNSATAGPISGNMVDRKAPGFSCDAPDGLWHATNVSLGCSASDDGSGLTPTTDATFSLSTTVTAGNETSNAATGTKGLSDAVGNTVTAGPIAGNMVDMKGPAITLTTPAATTYTLNQVVNANFGCIDGGSGVKATAGCVGTVNTGSAIDTGTIGVHSFKVDAEDNVNNKSSVSRNYSVAADFNGFLQPIDGNMVNTGKVGRVYPIKWQLRDDNDVLISDTAAQALIDQNLMKVEQRAGTTCNDYPSDALEAEAAGSSVLRYDATSDQFVYNYKAPATKGCYRVDVIKADGVNTQSIFFNFTK